MLLNEISHILKCQVILVYLKLNRCLQRSETTERHIMGQLYDDIMYFFFNDIIYYYDQNPLGFSFLVQITAFVI